ncbi:MAG: hypothetical protein JJ894_14085 [Dinoroseobacter sp.]|nr:hypothetical protein [Dinoroseobacter sp.]
MQRLDLTQLPVVAGSRYAPNTPLGYRVAKRTDASAEFLLEGTDLLNDEVTYSDVELKVKTANSGSTFTHHDGTPFQGAK